MSAIDVSVFDGTALSYLQVKVIDQSARNTSVDVQFSGAKDQGAYLGKRKRVDIDADREHAMTDGSSDRGLDGAEMNADSTKERTLIGAMERTVFNEGAVYFLQVLFKKELGYGSKGEELGICPAQELVLTGAEGTVLDEHCLKIDSTADKALRATFNAVKRLSLQTDCAPRLCPFSSIGSSAGDEELLEQSIGIRGRVNNKSW